MGESLPKDMGEAEEAGEYGARLLFTSVEKRKLAITGKTFTTTASCEARLCAAAACWRLRWRRQDSRGDLCCVGAGAGTRQGATPSHLVPHFLASSYLH